MDDGAPARRRDMRAQLTAGGRPTPQHRQSLVRHQSGDSSAQAGRLPTAHVARGNEQGTVRAT